jgi:citrate synthase
MVGVFMTTDILENVRKTIAEALQIEPDLITPDLAFGGIKQWDSMGHMGIMMLLEERFGIPVDADVIATLTSVPAICEYVSKSGGKS